MSFVPIEKWSFLFHKSTLCVDYDTIAYYVLAASSRYGQKTPLIIVSMKILLVCLEKEIKTVKQILPLLGKMQITVESLILKSLEDKSIGQFTAFFDLPFHDLNKKLLINGPQTNSPRDLGPTHVLILSPLPRGWFDFLAGFSCASRLVLLVFGQEVITGVSREFASSFTFLNELSSLETFLVGENEAFKKQEAARNIIEAQETLLRMGIPVTVESLVQCVLEGRFEEVAFFLAAGFSPDTRNMAGVPLLNIAARNGKREVVRFLLLAGAELNLQANDRGTSALIDSVMGKHYEIAKELIKAGADINVKSKDGQTALVVVVGYGDVNMAEALLKAGADPDITDNLGVSARKYAALFRNDVILNLFDTTSCNKED